MFAPKVDAGRSPASAVRTDEELTLSFLEGLHTDTRAAQPASVDPRLNSPATHPGCDGGGYHGGFRDRCAAAWRDGGGHHGGLGDGRADDADSAGA